MSKLILQNIEGKIVEVSSSQTLLQAIQNAGIDYMHACGAKGRCTTCRIKIVEGLENLSPRTSAELKYLELKKIKANERLTCQCFATGDVIGKVPNDSKLPHMNYSG